MTASPNPKSNPKSKITVLDDLAGDLLHSYLSDERARRISHANLPSREAIVEILEAVLDLMYPGYFGRQISTTRTLVPTSRTR